METTTRGRRWCASAVLTACLMFSAAAAAQSSSRDSGSSDARNPFTPQFLRRSRSQQESPK